MTSEWAASAGEDPQPSRPTRNTRVAIVLLGAGVVALAIAVAIGLIRPSGDDASSAASPGIPSPSSTTGESARASASQAASSESASHGPSPTVEPEPSPTTRPTGAAQVAWRSGSPHDGQVNAITAFEGSWIAGGSVGTSLRAAVWRSSDGITWTEALILPPEPTATDGFVGQYWINGFGTWDGTLLAYGWNRVGCCDGGLPMLWRSSDGMTWTEVETDGSAWGDAYHFPQTSLVADGNRLTVLAYTGLGSGTSIFTTTDLARWTEHPVSGDEDESVVFEGFAASPTTWLAVGSATASYTDRPRFVQRVWTSVDGMTWQSIEPPEADGALLDVAWDEAHEQFAVVGIDGSDVPAVWLTPDGRTWARTTLADTPGTASSIAAHDGLLVASGNEQPMGSAVGGRVVAWSSYDGITWSVVPLGEGSSSDAGVSEAGAVVLVNIFDDVRQTNWTAWAGTGEE